jgi:hypothetical protein
MTWRPFRQDSRVECVYMTRILRTAGVKEERMQDRERQVCTCPLKTGDGRYCWQYRIAGLLLPEFINVQARKPRRPIPGKPAGHDTGRKVVSPQSPGIVWLEGPGS